MSRDSVKEDEKGRKPRVPFGAHRTKLQVESTIPGYHLLLFNDQDGRIQRAERGGYEYVMSDEVPELGEGELHQKNSDLNSKVSKIVSRDGSELRAFLMKIKQEWYDEDQKVKQKRNDKVDEEMRQGKPGGNVVENQYVPEGHEQKI